MTRRLFNAWLGLSKSDARRWLAAACWMLALFIFSSVPGNEYPKVNVRYADKWVHLILYGTLGFLVARGLFRPTRRLSLVAHLLLAVTISSAYGVTDEIHQLWVPLRSCDFYDWLADTNGALLGAAAWLAGEWYFRTRVTAQPNA